MRNLTKTTYLAGITIILYSIVRWGGFIYDDFSNMVFGVLIGLIICGFAYFHNWMGYKDLKIKSIDDRIDSLVISLRDRDVIKQSDLVIG
jgi:hypothetical protein